MLSLSTAFSMWFGKGTFNPVFLVDLGVTNGKFTDAGRRMFNYPPSVSKVSQRNSSIDPLECRQGLSALEIEFFDDGYVRDLLNANNLQGKTVTVKLGADPGNDTDFPEGSFAPYFGAIFDSFTGAPGVIRILTKDPRVVGFSRGGSAIRLPLFQDASGNSNGYTAQGAATVGLRNMLAAGLVSSSLYSSASFDIASSPLVGHLVLDRRRIQPATMQVGAFTISGPDVPVTSDRSLKTQQPLQDCLDQVSKILRGYVLVQEDGLIGYKQYDPTSAAVYRFTANEMVPDSVTYGLDMKTIIRSVQLSTGWEGLSAGGGPGYRLTLLDQDGAAQTTAGYTDGSKNVADHKIEDAWFSTQLLNSYKDVLAGDTLVFAVGDNVTGAILSGTSTSANNPASAGVDASHPGYLFVRGTIRGPVGTSDPGEIIKYTVVNNPDADVSHRSFGGLTRGMFGTAAADHYRSSPRTVGAFTYDDGDGVVVWDITAAVRCMDQIINRFKDAAGTLEFKTSIASYAPQLADIVYAETPLYLRPGLNGLAVGNTTPFEVVRKDIDVAAKTITWGLVEVRNPGRTPVHIPHFTHGPLAGLGDPGYHPPHHVGGLFSRDLGGLAFNVFIEGDVPAPIASLTGTIPYQRVMTKFGPVVMPDTGFAFTASKDTYVDLAPGYGGISFWNFTSVANGAGAPALATGLLRAFKVVTNGSAITSATDLRNITLVDGARNIVLGSIDTAILKDGAITNVKVNSAAGIVGTKLAAGAGVLTHLSSVGALDNLTSITTRVLDSLTDGTYGKLLAAGISAGKLISAAFNAGAVDSAAIAAGAITATKLGNLAVVAGKIDVGAVHFADLAANVISPSLITTAVSFNGNLIPNANFSSFPTASGVNSPPDGWSVTSSTWDATHMSASKTVLLSGAYSLKFGLVLSRGETPTIKSQPFPVIGGRQYDYGAEWYHSSGVANGNVTVYIDWLDDNMAALSSSSGNVLSGGLTAAWNRWDYTIIAPAGARYAVMRLVGTDPTSIADHNFYIDYLWMTDAPDVGSTFPTAPATGQRFFRDDRGIEYFYDGTRWLSTVELCQPQQYWNTLPGAAFSATNTTITDTPVPRSDSGKVYVTHVDYECNVGATNDATHYWAITFGPGILSTDTKTLGTSGWFLQSNTVNSERTVATDRRWEVGVTKNGSGTTPLYILANVYYRLVG